MKKFRRSIVVDFDGTLVTNEYPGWGRLQSGAYDAMMRLHNHYDILVSSCRVSPFLFNSDNARDPREVENEIGLMREFLNAQGLDPLKIHTNAGKPFGVAYIDDRGIQYEGHDDAWEEIADMLIAEVEPKDSELGTV